ncbi:MAG: TolC family protein [Planctomycetes bacterium]|nr:TolC family protein [Planctomycetota bacterium]
MTPFRRPIRIPFCFLALLGATAWGIATATEGEPVPPDPSTTKLVEAFVRQARSTATNRDEQAHKQAFVELTASISEKREAWVKRIGLGLGDADLIAGLPGELRSKARGAGASPEQATTLLQAEASLPLVMLLAAERNPEARVAFEALRSTLRRFEQAAYLEELVAQYRSFARELDTKVGPQSHKEMPEKTFPFPSALALKGQAIDQDAELARLKYIETLRKGINDAARGFFSVQFAERQVAILKENRDLFAKMDAIAAEQLKVGRASQADSLKAQSELAMLETQVLTAERERTNAIAKVNAVLGLPPETPWGTLRPADLADEDQALDELLKLASRNNQALAGTHVEVALMETMVRMAETMVLPRGSQGASLIAPSVGAEAGPTRSEMAAFPIMQKPSAERAGFGANAAYIDELRVRVQQAQRMRDAMESDVAFMVKDAHFMADATARERKTLAESVVPKARQALETYRERYTTAATPFIEYLDSARLYLNSSLSLEKARMQHNRALVDLEGACGRSAARLLPGSREEQKP